MNNVLLHNKLTPKLYALKVYLKHLLEENPHVTPEQLLDLMFKDMKEMNKHE